MLEDLGNAVEGLMARNPGELAGPVLKAVVPGLAILIERQNALLCKWVLTYKVSGVWSVDGSKSAAHAFARKTGLSVSAAKQIFNRAKKLEQMPLVFAEYLAGKLSTSRVDTFAGVCTDRVQELFQRDERMLLDSTRDMQFKDAKRVLDYWLQCADEEGTKKKAEKQLDDRNFNMVQTFGGGWDISGSGDPISGQIAFNELDRIYQQMFEADWAEFQNNENATVADLPRSPAQRRWDAFVEMSRRSAAMAPGSKMTRPLVTIIAGEESMKNICELADGTVIAPNLVVEYLCEIDFETMIYDGNSRVIDFKGQRSFKGALERILRARDRHCKHPSQCDVPASKCELDHNEAWINGGQTDQDNGQCMCGQHNRLKGAGPPTRAA